MKRLREIDILSYLMLAASAITVLGLALIYPPAAMIVPGVSLLALGWKRGWY